MSTERAICDTAGCTRHGSWTHVLSDGSTEHLCHRCWSHIRLQTPAVAFAYTKLTRLPQLTLKPQTAHA
jgi:hypothetical protein